MGLRHIGSVILQWCEVYAFDMHVRRSVAGRWMHVALLWSDGLVLVVLDSSLSCSDHPAKVEAVDRLASLLVATVHFALHSCDYRMGTAESPMNSDG